MFILIRLIIDALLVSFSFVIAYLIKFSLLNLSALVEFPYALYARQFGLIVLVYVATFYLLGLYRTRKGFLLDIDEMLGVFVGASAGWVLLIALTFLYGEYEYSRNLVVISWPITFILLLFSRLLILRLELFARAKGLGSKRAAIIGDGDLARAVAQKIKDHPSYGIVFAGFLRYENQARLEAAIKGSRIEMLFVADPALDRAKLTELAAFCGDLGIELGTFPDVFEILTTSPAVENIEGMPTISLKRSAFSSPSRFFKRLFDLVLAVFGLVVFSVPMLVIWLLVKVFSPGGPAVYRQERVGRGGRTFDLLKFRTMIPDAEAETGPVLAAKGGDPRKTPFGKVLRATNLDELPQLFNILKGDMSFVGPRPERPVFVNQFKEMIPKYMERHKIRPGLAGWAQLNGGYHMPAEEKIKYDLYYIENWSFLLDIKIIIKYIQIAFTFQRKN